MYHGNHFRQVGSPENFRRENPTDPERIRTKINFGLDYSRNCVIIKLKSPQEGKSLMTAEFTFHVSAGKFDFIPFNRNLESFFATHRLPQNKLFTIELIVEELVTNTQKYGGGGKIFRSATTPFRSIPPGPGTSIPRSPSKNAKSADSDCCSFRKNPNQ